MAFNNFTHHMGVWTSTLTVSHKVGEAKCLESCKAIMREGKPPQPGKKLPTHSKWKGTHPSLCLPHINAGFKIPIIKTFTHCQGNRDSFPGCRNYASANSDQFRPTSINIDRKPRPLTSWRKINNFTLMYIYKQGHNIFLYSWSIFMYAKNITHSEVTSIPRECQIGRFQKISISQIKERYLFSL